MNARLAPPIYAFILFLFVGWVLASAEETSPSLPADFRPALGEALRRHDSKITIPPGTYRLAPPAGSGAVWVLQGAHDAEIVADGVTLISTKLTRAVALENCAHIT